jgi:cytochrome c556
MFSPAVPVPVPVPAKAPGIRVWCCSQDRGDKNMKRIVCMGGVLAILLAAAIGSGSAGAQNENESIKAIMGKLHKGADSPLGTLKAQLKTAAPDWAKIQDEAKDFVMLGASLSRFDPPRGDAPSYKKLATAYYNHAKDLDTAAQKQDLPATKAAFGKLSASCKECHTAHKGQ